ncbi:MAG: CapA family protein [Cytophagales bacterium]|nr:CapA family protein [Cytophagales bacterium]
MKKALQFFCIFMIILIGCKPQRVIVQTPVEPQPKDTVVVVPAKPIFITSEGDTLESLEKEVDLSLTTVQPDTISIIAVGDIMMGTNFPNKSYLPADSGNLLWKSVGPLLKDADITFGNLEGVILDEGGEAKECKNPKACYLFRTPDHLSRHFTDNGFDLLSLANNHANDFGATGRKNTQKVLDSIGIAFAGSIELPSTRLNKKRVRIGMVAVSPNKGTLLIHDEAKILAIVQQLDSLNDLVIVSFHAGAEGSKNKHVTRKREYYYGEDRGNVYEFSHRMIDHGADLLIGHGPHVPRAMEIYKDRIIAYSLGNFLTYGRFNLRGTNGEAPLLKLWLTPEGKFLTGKIESFYQDYSLGPRPDKKLRALKSIKNLTQEDFPETPLTFDDSGRIIYLQNEKQN